MEFATKKLVKDIVIIWALILVLIPILNSIFMSWLGIYNTQIDNTGNYKYSVYPIYGGKYLNNKNLDDLHRWYSKTDDFSDIEQFLNFIKESGLKVGKSDLKKFLVSNRICEVNSTDIKRSCDRYINIVWEKTLTDKITDQKVTTSIYLPNPYLWKPAEWWNSALKIAMITPKWQNLNWYDTMLFKVSIDNYIKASKWQLTYNSWAVIVYKPLPDLENHCNGRLIFQFKEKDCWTSWGSTNTDKEAICPTKDILFQWYASDLWDAEEFLTKHRQAIENNNMVITKICWWVWSDDNDEKVSKEISYNQFLQEYFDYVVWYSISSHYTYLSLDKDNFLTTMKEIYSLYKEDVKNDLDDKTLSEIKSAIEIAMKKYFNTNYANDTIDKWYIDKFVDMYFSDTNNFSEDNKWDLEAIIYRTYIRKYIVAYKLYVDKFFPDLNTQEKQKKVKELIKKDINYLQKDLLDDISKTRKNLITNWSLNVELTFDLITVSNWQTDIKDAVNSIMWFSSPAFVDGILINPIYYKGNFVVMNKTLMRAIGNQTDTANIWLNNYYPFYFLEKTKLYEKWDNMSDTWKLISQYIFKYIVPYLGFIVYVLDTLIIWVWLLLVSLFIIMAVMKDSVKTRTWLSVSDIQEMKSSVWKD